MNGIRISIKIILFTGTLFLLQCSNQKTENKGGPDYLLLVTDSDGKSGYSNLRGEVVIPPGKYSMCLTDTFKSHAVVVKDHRFVVIDRQEKELYEVFPFDNGPDYPADGLFRIMQNGKIGYADAGSFQVVITPQYDCAEPFVNGTARVSVHCQQETDGEHSRWVSDNWTYIDKKGQAVKAPATN